MDIKYFKSTGTFSAVHKAESYVEKLGYSYGLMCMDEPIALAKGDVSITKWRNIPSSEYPRIDGLILSHEFREGDVAVVIFDDADRLEAKYFNTEKYKKEILDIETVFGQYQMIEIKKLENELVVRYKNKLENE